MTEKRQSKGVGLTRKEFLQLGGTAALLLSAVACGIDPVITPEVPEQPVTNPTEGVPKVSTEVAPLPEDVESISGNSTVEVLGQEEILGELRSVFGSEDFGNQLLTFKDSQFKESVEQSRFFDTGEGFQSEFVGIKVKMEGEDNDKVYLFFSTESIENEDKGFLSYVVSGEGAIGAASLERVETEDGKVALGILQHPLTQENLQDPFVIFATEYSQEEVVTILDEGVESIDVYFMLGLSSQTESNNVTTSMGRAKDFMLVDFRNTVEFPALNQGVQSWIDSNEKASYDNKTGIVTMLVEVDGVETEKEMFKVNEDGSMSLETVTFDMLKQSEPISLTKSMDTLKVEPKKGNNLMIDTGERVGLIYRDGVWREILLDIEFSTSGENIYTLPEIYPDDVTSGRLAEAERLEASHFAEDIKMLDLEYDNFIDGVSFDKGDEDIKDMGIELPFFYRVKFEYQDGVLMTMKIMNKDKTESFLHMSIDIDAINLVPDTWRGLINLINAPGFSPGIGDFCDIPSVSYGDLYTGVVCPMNLPDAVELKNLMNDWTRSGQIPDELERVISGQSWRMVW